MSYGADWTCECGWANLDVRRRCRSCGKDRPDAPPRPKPPAPFTNVQFAQRAALISSIAAKWARDILDSPEERANAGRVEEFCMEIAGALDRISQASLAKEQKHG